MSWCKISHRNGFQYVHHILLNLLITTLADYVDKTNYTHKSFLKKMNSVITDRWQCKAIFYTF